MIRRRRPVREISFSFDSFLDVVANVTGIIIRLILVVWVGARSYTSMTAQARRRTAPAQGMEKVEELKDPLQQEMTKHRQELAAAQARLLEQLRQAGVAQTRDKQTRNDLAALEKARQRQALEGSALERAAGSKRSATQAVALSMDELRRKEKKLREEILALEKMPRLKKVIHYRTPVSAPLDSEEILFECRYGRVSYIEIAAMLSEAGRTLDDKVRQLQHEWRVEDVAGPVGGFRLHYTVERLHGLLDGDAEESQPPSPSARFGYGLTGWQLEPTDHQRGEDERTALAEGSLFRRVVDSLDPRQAAVTIFVYPDSFGLYRKLRDYLYDHEVVVAGRPLPDGIPITCSRRGSRSRGQ
jgi:hypothetical protein